MEKRDPKWCNGIVGTGYWKGRKCGAIGKYVYRGKNYCANHFPPTQKAKGKIKK